jgi:hypothetical protein
VGDTTTMIYTAEDTSLAAAQANVLASSTAMVAHLNEELKNRYYRDFANWKISVDAGRITNENPPKVPNGYELVKDDEGFTFPELGKTPVCDPLPVPEDMLTPNTIDIGHLIFGKWYSVGEHDTFPSGMTTPPQPDGHVYEKFGAPVGPGWYLQVS